MASRYGTIGGDEHAVRLGLGGKPRWSASRRPQWRGGAWRVLAAVSALSLAGFACKSTPSVVHPAHLPAKTLIASITLTHAGSAASDYPTTHVSVAFTQDAYTWVELSGSQRVSCDGVPLRQDVSLAYLGDVPHVAPGGTYDVTYTDEQGVATTIHVPVPTGTLAITDPKPNATLPQPHQSFSIRYTAVRVPGGDDVLFVFRAYGIAGGQDLIESADNSGRQGYVPGVITFTFSAPGGYTVPAGPGQLRIEESETLTLPPVGFKEVRVAIGDEATIPVTWQA
jgi:hypothetical protein